MTSLLIRLFIKDSENVTDRDVRERYGRLGGTVGILCNLLLCLIKITVGLLSGAISVVADGLNNLTDMGSSVITLIGFRMAAKPADSDHPFGHGRMEYISAFVVSLLILLVGVELMKSSVSALFGGEGMPAYTVWTAVALFISVAVKLWVLSLTDGGKTLIPTRFTSAVYCDILPALSSTLVRSAAKYCAG